MSASIDRGIKGEGLLPGGLKVRRRARAIHNRLLLQQNALGPAQIFEWVSLFALAVNEENAAGGRVVTAPTNGARSEEHTSELQSLMRISYDVFCLKKNTTCTPAHSTHISYLYK